ncbi:hypothetical protein CKO22_09795 [Thiococcus pfennigii]|jgi:hypothetical protein|nr:hypothetical protein [Thiococcus pfennigii]
MRPVSIPPEQGAAGGYIVPLRIDVQAGPVSERLALCCGFRTDAVDGRVSFDLAIRRRSVCRLFL